jgi:predicted ester cyclase
MESSTALMAVNRPAERIEMSEAEESKAVVRRYFEVLDQGRAQPVSMCTDDFTFYVAGFAPMNLASTIEFAKIFFEGLPDLRHPLEEVIAEGSTVAFRCRYEGTHTAEFMGAAPTGNKVSFHGIGLMRVVDGKVSEFYVSPDRVSMMQQIGLMPADA